MSNNDLRSTLAPNSKNSPVATVSHYFEKHKKQLAMALPKHLNADRMTRLALTAMSQNKALAECDPVSLFGSVIMASQLGLEIGVLGQGYLVPYKRKATFIPGWQGLVDLVSRAGRATVWTGAVFECDEFDFQLGDAPFCKHKPMGEDDPAKLTHVYAVGRVNGAALPVIEVWPIKRIYKHRDRYNKVGQQHYSYGNWEMYARKVPLLQVLKYMPKSVELSNALMADHAYDQGRETILDGDFVDLGSVVAGDGEIIDQATGEVITKPHGNGGASAEKPADNPGPEETIEVKLSDVQTALETSKNIDELNEAGDLIRSLKNSVHRDQMNALYDERRAALTI